MTTWEQFFYQTASTIIILIRKWHRNCSQLWRGKYTRKWFVLTIPTTRYFGHEHAISVFELAYGHIFPDPYSRTTWVCVLVMCMTCVWEPHSSKSGWRTDCPAWVFTWPPSLPLSDCLNNILKQFMSASSQVAIHNVTDFHIFPLICPRMMVKKL